MTEERQRRAIVGVLIATLLSFGLVVATDLAFGWLRPRSTTSLEMLKVQPNVNRIYLLGNSIFKTGIDVHDLETQLGGSIGVDFEEHVGHYTNLWYLIVKNAIVDAESKPRLLVWGFRPTYANRPGFRQRRICDIERFHGPSEDLYKNLTGGTNVEGATPWRGRLAVHSNLYRRRMNIRNHLFNVLQNWTLSGLNLLAGPEAVYLENDLASGLALSEVIRLRVNRDRYRMAEESLVDRGKQFVVGPTVSFAQSFVPVITEMIERAGIPQLVLIFKPVSELEGERDARARSFTRNAVAYFESHDIANINFFDEPLIQRIHYASGDHYNEAGRRLVTRLLAEALDPNAAARDTTVSNSGQRGGDWVLR